MVIGKEINSAAQTWELMTAVLGHRLAKAALENACWDLEASRRLKSSSTSFAGWSLANLMKRLRRTVLGNLKIFSGVRDFPVRVKCASLPGKYARSA